MSEAVLVAILIPIAGALSTLIVKFWEYVANIRKDKRDEGAAYRDELRKDLDRKNKEIEQLKSDYRDVIEKEQMWRKEKETWQMYYWELLSKYRAFFVVANSQIEGFEEKEDVPHEREDR